MQYCGYANAQAKLDSQMTISDSKNKSFAKAMGFPITRWNRYYNLSFVISMTILSPGFKKVE